MKHILDMKYYFGSPRTQNLGRLIKMKKMKICFAFIFSVKVLQYSAIRARLTLDPC